LWNFSFSANFVLEMSRDAIPGKEVMNMLESGENPKYKIEAWISVLSRLHPCLGLNLEGGKHPACQKVLEALIKDIEDVKNSL